MKPLGTASPVVPSNVEREKALQGVVMAYIVTGLLFMLLPGTFLGVWNLIAISASRGAQGLSPAWVQAHGHAQIFGWIGTFIIGIGFYSLSKMGELKPYVVRRAWLAWALWTAGVTGRWAAGVYAWHWRIMLPLSAGTECVAFLLFFSAVRQHRPRRVKSDLPVLSNPPDSWMKLVLASTFGFLTALCFHLGIAVWVAVQGTGPQFPRASDQRLLTLCVWGFLVLSVWGFNARWLPMFAGLRPASERGLLWACCLVILGVTLAFVGWATLSSVVLLCSALLAAVSLRVFAAGAQPARTQGIHAAFPYFARAAYGWLLLAACLSIWASLADRHGGILGASRHAITVGFIGTMVFAIGPRLLPGFCGAPRLFSKNLMFGALLLLNIGCLLRVASQIPAYENHFGAAWSVLPVSAVVELSAVALFAVNLLATFARRSVRILAVSQAAA